MSELNEKELLILSNYLYMDHSVTKGNIGNILQSLKGEDGEFDTTKIGAISGGMDTKDALYIFKEMDASSATFKDLQVTQVINEEGIRGACFVNDIGEATVIYRGTGGNYNAWTDNIIAEYLRETILQKKAAEFIDTQCAEYPNITVAGHSKGGNFAQYVTVVCKEKVDRCISYDGQGFNRDFVHFYQPNITDVRKKITSISAHNDYVNILLLSIAGKRIFVENNESGLNAHSGIPLLKDNVFDQNGNFASLREQDEELHVLEGFLADGVIFLDDLPNEAGEKVVDALGAILAGALSADKSERFEKEMIKRHLLEFAKTINTTASEGFKINLCVMSEAQQEMSVGVKHFEQVKEEIQMAIVKTGIEDSVVALSRKLLIKIMEQVEKEGQLLYQMTIAMEHTIAAYQKAENNIISEISTSCRNIHLTGRN